MRVIALLALVFGLMSQGLLDGQVFTHAVFGTICGIAAVVCGLASSRKDRQHRWEGWIMAGLGFALGVWCMVMLPSTYGQEQRFNERSRKHREQREKQNHRPSESPPANQPSVYGFYPRVS